MNVIVCDSVVAPTGPYSQAVCCGGTIYVSGTLGYNNEKFHLETSLVAQTERALLNIDAILRSADSSLRRVVKVTVFVLQGGDFHDVNIAYANVFNRFNKNKKSGFPARSTVQVSALPQDALVMIEAIALMGGGLPPPLEDDEQDEDKKSETTSSERVETDPKLSPTSGSERLTSAAAASNERGSQRSENVHVD